MSTHFRNFPVDKGKVKFTYRLCNYQLFKEIPYLYFIINLLKVKLFCVQKYGSFHNGGTVCRLIASSVLFQ